MSSRVLSVSRFLDARGSPKFRLEQVLDGIYKHHAEKWYDIPNIPKQLQYDLTENFGKYISTLNPIQQIESKEAIKQLFSCRADYNNNLHSKKSTKSDSKSFDPTKCGSSDRNGAPSDSIITSSATTSGVPDSIFSSGKPNVRRTIDTTTFGGSSSSTTSVDSSASGTISKIEAVSLKFPSHRSLCISSQVGCAFKCAFCATGSIGFKRQLTADEVADQVLFFKNKHGNSIPHGNSANTTGHYIDSISIMGMGESLANPKIFDAIDILTNPLLMNYSQRRINVSTIGVIPAMLKLMDRFPQVNLAFSLHSPFTEERDILIPLNKMYPFEEVFRVLDKKIAQTGRRVWIAYLLLPGTNDTLDHARALCDLISKRPVESRHLYHVNLLPYNKTDKGEQEGWREKSGMVEDFMSILEKNRISASYRNAFGTDIDAACGQLYANYQKNKAIAKSTRGVTSCKN